MDYQSLKHFSESFHSVWIGKEADHSFRIAGSDTYWSDASGGHLSDFENWLEKGDLAGFVSYDLKDAFEEVLQAPAAVVDFPLFHFFPAEHSQIINLPTAGLQPGHVSSKCLLSKEEYLNRAGMLLKHIGRGDIYEVNFCIPFEGSGSPDPLLLFLALHEISPMPFSCFMKIGDKYIVSASPERFLKKEGNVLMSQPMKGTALRGVLPDHLVKDKLQNDPKERAENIMITDLVRNDLSRIAEKGSVKVEELCGVHAFPGLFQMISTVACRIGSDVSFLDILRAMFPMGSMTGAPKVSAMNLIAAAEPVSRGPFSGSAGFFKKNGDFDLNVLIRSVFLDSSEKRFTFSAGSALTASCQPETEYEECMIKASKILSLLHRNAE